MEELTAYTSRTRCSALPILLGKTSSPIMQSQNFSPGSRNQASATRSDLTLVRVAHAL